MDYVRVEHGYSLARACKLISLSRSLYYYVSVRDDGEVIEKHRTFRKEAHRGPGQAICEDQIGRASMEPQKSGQSLQDAATP